jgi:hypothetical protein
LVIAAFPPRVFAVPNKEHPFLRIEVRPFHSADFVLTHCRRDGESDDSPDRNLLVGICIKSGD